MPNIGGGKLISFGLSDDFTQDDQKQKQWRAFLKKNALEPIPLNEVILVLRQFLTPLLDAAHQELSFGRQ